MAGEYNCSNEYLINEDRREKIATFISDVLRPAKKTLRELEIQEYSVSDFESRDYQIEAWDALWHARENGADRGLIHLATGLGKTSIAVFDYAKFRSEQMLKNESAKCLFVVHQNNILEQASDRFSEVLPELKNVRLQGTKVDSDAELNFATFQTLINNIDKIPSDAFDYITYDEAHHIEADTYKKVVEHFNPRFQLGLTATPDRMDEKDITNHFGEALYTKKLPEALAEGYLASVKYTPMYDEAVLELINSGFSAGKLDQLGQLLEIEPRNEEIVKKIREKQQEIRDQEGCDAVKTIIFCADTNHADSIAELMEGESYHSLKNSQHNDGVLNRFRNNGLETITVRDMFNEGVDIPDARLVVFLRTTQSKTIFEQQLGRGLRKTCNKTRVDVLDFVANIERLDMANELSEDVKKISSRLGTRNGGYIEGNKEHSEEADIDRFDFQFSPQVVGFLKNYRFLIESRQPRIDWKEYSNEELVSLALEISPNSFLSKAAMITLCKDNKFPSATYIRNRFGSIVEFQRLCGFNVVDRSSVRGLSNSELVDLALKISPKNMLDYRSIKELSDLGRFINPNAIARRFGSLLEFQKACGFEVSENITTKMSNEELAALALEISDSPLRAADIDILSMDNKFPSYSTIVNRFGSVSKFHQACGFKISERVNCDNYSNEDLVSLALEICPGGPLTVKSINNLYKAGDFPSYDYIQKRFGLLSNFHKACGFDKQ